MGRGIYVWLGPGLILAVTITGQPVETPLLCQYDQFSILCSIRLLSHDHRLRHFVLDSRLYHLQMLCLRNQTWCRAVGQGRWKLQRGLIHSLRISWNFLPQTLKI